MTNEFKKNILDYITNNVNQTASSDTQIIENIEEIPKSWFSNYLPNGWNELRATGIIHSNINGMYAIYGGYIEYGGTQANNSRGFITILDSNFKPVDIILNYSSGTPLRPIQKMIQIEDGTFVAVDSTLFAYKTNRSSLQTNEKRFIMLNNFLMETALGYRLILRTSYIIPNEYKNFYCLDIVKNPQTSHYILAGAIYYPVSTWYVDGVRVIDLKINVGEPNEWINTATTSSNYYIYSGLYVEFSSNDTANWKVAMTNNDEPKSFGFWDGSSYQVIMNKTGNISPYVDSLTMNNQMVFLNSDTLYFTINNQTWGSGLYDRYVGLYKYTISTNELKEIFFKNIGQYDVYIQQEGIFLNVLNGDIYVNYFDNYDNDNMTANLNYQRLENDIWRPILIRENEKYRLAGELNATSNIYNIISNITLNNTMITSEWGTTKIKEVYNNSNYNSVPYNDYNSMISRQGKLYKNTDLLFARNLYDRTINGSTTTSIVNVPNSMLNDTEINVENLIGATNGVLVSNTLTITKNVYENLYINFVNSINVVDEDTDTYYPSVANYINQNINVGTQENCETTFASKVRINYSTPIEKNIIWTWNTDHYETGFGVDTSQEIPTSVDFISSEGNIYLTKTLNLVANKLYSIKQKLRIE